MSRARDEFIAAITREGIPVDVARMLLRHAKTLHRLAERECNGDDWASGDLVACPNGACNGEPVGCGYCPECGGSKGGHGRVTRSQRRTARLEARVRTLCTPYNLVPLFSGDPRWAVLRLHVPSGRTDDWGGTGLCVPVT